MEKEYKFNISGRKSAVDEFFEFCRHEDFRVTDLVVMKSFSVYIPEQKLPFFLDNLYTDKKYIKFRCGDPGIYSVVL